MTKLLEQRTDICIWCGKSLAGHKRVEGPIEILECNHAPKNSFTWMGTEKANGKEDKDQG